MKYDIQVKVKKKRGKPVPITISSNDFTKNGYPSIEEFQEFPFLREKYFDYVKENNSEGTAKSYISYLSALFNELPFTLTEKDLPRKWLLLLPYFFTKDEGDLGFQVLTYWMNRLNEYISELKDSNAPFKTFQNRKSALQAYINFLTEMRDETPSVFNNEKSKNSRIKVVNKIETEFERQYTGITIPVEGTDGLISTFISRMRSEDRFPTKSGAVFYPARIISTVLKKEFNNLANDCIRKVKVFTEKGTFVLNDLECISIDKNGNTKAKIKSSSEWFVILNKENENCNPLIAKSEADLSREHNPSISTILEDETRQWNALKDLTDIIKKIDLIPKQENASKLKQEVMQNYEQQIQGMKEKLKIDFKNILNETKFSLMQRSLNSSLNKHE